MNESIMRSAMASKLAYADTCRAAARFPIARTLHGDTVSIHHPCRVIEDVRSGSHIYSWSSGERSKVVAFRGTHDCHDAITFLDMKPQNLRFKEHSVNLHSGVYGMFRGIEAELTDHIMRARGCVSVTFTGHSLGGALSMLAAAYYGALTHRNMQIKCHTFGACRTGDAAFVDWYKENVHESVSVVAEHDIVPDLPCGSWYEQNPDRVLLRNDDLNLWTAHELDTYCDLLNRQLRLQKDPPCM